MSGQSIGLPPLIFASFSGGFSFDVSSPYVIFVKKTLPYCEFGVYYSYWIPIDPRKPGKKIKLARIELDLTQTQLAQKNEY